MAPKKKADPVVGQRSIAAFFSSKPKGDGPPQAAPAAKLAKPTHPGDTLDAKTAAAAPAAAAPPVQRSTPAAVTPKTQPQQAPAAAAAAAGGALGAAAVGRALKVYWPADKAWYQGEVLEFSGASGKHLVLYSDGDEEWVDLATEKYEFLPAAGAKPAAAAGKKAAAAAAGRKRKAAIVESDGEEASGSEYAASMEGESGSEDESMEEEVESSEDEDASPTPAGARGGAKGKGKGARSGGGGTKPGKAAAASAGGSSAAKQATPAAVNNGSVGLTPASGAFASFGATTTGGKKAGSTAARPPRPSLPGKTPGSAATPATAMLSRKLTSGTPATGAGEEGAETPGTALREGGAALAAEGPARFGDRETTNFPFLRPDKIRDANKRRPDDDGYDARTLYIPPDWFKQNKISPGQQQWWEFKARHFDCVLLFKMGKFYELFEMDAHTAVESIGLSYMKGDQPHAGFPEAAYHGMAEKLARAGHKVVVIEQTETPDMLAVRNEERRRQGLKKEGVVRREKVAVLTKATLTDAEMLSGQPEASYLMALAELPVPEEAMKASEGTGVPPRVWVGACAVDVASGQMLVGQWLDDELRSQSRGVLTAVQPAEVVVPRDRVSTATLKVVKGILRCPRVNELPPGDGQGQFWDAETCWDQVDAGAYFSAAEGGEGRPMPDVLAELRQQGASQAAAAHALGGCLSYLQEVLLDKQVLAAGRVELLAECFGIGAALKSAPSSGGPAYMALDGAALENLEILENSEGGIAGTLISALDHCTTPVGRRRLRQWLCRPLYRMDAITERQDAVADLMGPAEDAAAAARKLLNGMSDLERALARLNAMGAGVGSARDAPHVILYEGVAKKRVLGFVTALRGLQRILDAAAVFDGVRDELTSGLLRRLVTPGELFPDMAAALQQTWAVTDWDEACSTGRVEPAAGVNADYDAAEQVVGEAEQALTDYLQEMRRVTNCRQLGYVSVNKDSHVLEAPESLKVPSNWEPCQGKKGIKRYTSSALKQLVRQRDAAYDTKERVQSGILRTLIGQFAERKELWAAAVDCMAQLDALMSLAISAACSSGNMCRPQFVEWKEADGDAPLFRARALRHPTMAGSATPFVPNDVQLGGAAAPFVVLTGPNMGGKSTLMRQVALACVMAQVGAYVPADALELTPVDATFVRMGAQDRIMLAQSTFMVEMSETSAALHRATAHSLVILDELGRGTSTIEGCAIAAAVLDYLAQRTRCRGLFATHYHSIADSHAEDPHVALKHMACKVMPPSESGGAEEVTFLYRLDPGACPKSYGANVARLAGLPEEIVQLGQRVALEHERARLAGVRPNLAALTLGGGPAAGGGAMEVDGQGPAAAAAKEEQPAAAGAGGGGSGGAACAEEVELLQRALAAVKLAEQRGWDQEGWAAVGEAGAAVTAHLAQQSCTAC